MVRIWEDSTPSGKGPVGSHYGALSHGSTDELEEKISMPVGIRGVTNLVNNEQARRLITQTPTQSRIATKRGEAAEQFASSGKQKRVTIDQGVIGDIFDEYRLANFIGSHQDCVGRVLEKVERHHRFDGGTIAAF